MQISEIAGKEGWKMNMDARSINGNGAGLYEGMEKLSSMRSRTMTGSIFVGAGLVIGFCGYVFTQSVPLIIFGILSGVIGVLFITSVSKKYKETYKRIFVEGPLNRNFQHVIYDWKSGFTKEAVRSFGLTAIGNRFRSEDYIRAVFDGVPFEMSDVTVQDVRSTGRSTYTVTYFKGRMLVFDFPDKAVGSVQVFTDNFKYRGRPFGNMKPQKVEMEGVNFNRRFDVTALSPHDAFYLLTPQFMEKLDYLASNYVSMGIHFCGTKVFVGFNEPYNNAFDAKSMMNKISYPEEIEKTEKELNDIKFIISMIREMPKLQNTVSQTPQQNINPVPDINRIPDAGQAQNMGQYNANDYYTVV